MDGSIASFKIENNKIGSHSDSFPNLDLPMKSPMTISTVGVTEAVTMSSDFSRMTGIVILKLPTNIPRTTEINRGFVKVFFIMFLATFFLFFSVE